MADWSQLPGELLNLVSEKFDNCFDLVHFRSVCSSWRSSALPRSHHLSLSLKCDLPRDNYECGQYYYLEKRPVFLFGFQPHGHKEASSSSWLVKIREKESGSVEVKDPFYNMDIPVFRAVNPSFSPDTLNCRVVQLGHECIVSYGVWIEHNLEEVMMVTRRGKVGFMQLGKHRDDYAVLGVLGFGKLALYTSADKQWTVLKDTPEQCEDIVSFRGKFYAIDDVGRTVVVKPSRDVSFFPQAVSCSGKKYLVQSGDDELYLVAISYSRKEAGGDYLWDRTIIQFEVFKLDKEELQWDPVNDLGNNVLFVGNNCTFSCLAEEIPGARGNCIIFQDFSRGNVSPHNISVYDLAGGSVRPFAECPGFAKLFWPPLNWVIPTSV